MLVKPGRRSGKGEGGQQTANQRYNKPVHENPGRVKVSAAQCSRSGLNSASSLLN
jgi:hypothetical protein